MKKLFTILFTLALCLTLFGCSNSNNSNNTNQENTTSENTANEEKPQMLYYCAYLGDFGLYDLGHTAAKQAAEKYNMDLTVVEYGQDSSVAVNSYLDALENKKYDYVLGLGWYIDGVAESAAETFPDTTFIYFDTSADVKYEHSNIYGVSFAQNEGGFLVGIYSALMSSTHKIAIINGGDAPIFNDFGTGWLAGAKYAKQDLGLDVTYTYTYVGESSLSGYYESSTSLLDSGNDVLWPISAINMLGACQAAEDHGGIESGIYIIGCDYDQWAYYDNLVQTGGKALGYENLATSMVKNIPPCVMAIFESILGDGNITSGNRIYGIKDGGVGIVENEHYKEITPTEVQTTIKEISDKVSSGEIDVPSYFDFSSPEAFATYRDTADAPFVK